MALELNKIPAGPYLVPLLETQMAGVDFLNLRQTNFDLMDECLPGTGNATKAVRGYSVIAWVYWVYPKILQRVGRTTAESEELILFREKVESLYVWGHQLAGLSGIPGISSKPPAPRNGHVDLRFGAWKRSRSNTSFEAAVQYGPSLLDLGGLGVLNKLADGMYACTAIGAPLGEAMDHCLRKCPAYEFLTDLRALEGTPGQAETLLPHWRFDETSPAEAAAFRAILWNQSMVDASSPAGRRSAMVELILSILRSATGPLSTHEIRRRLAFPDSLTSIAISPGMLRQSRSWLVLQLRQLQRMALESLMSWMEGELRRRGHQFPDRIVDRAHAAVTKAYGLDETATTADALEVAGAPIRSLQDLENLSEQAPERFSPWRLAQDLRDAVMKGTDESLTIGLRSLLLLHHCRPLLTADDRLKRHLERGGSTRVGLAYWFQLVDRCQSRSLRDLLDWVFKNFIISQHLAVATQRYDGQKSRLRMILEEDGLESLANRPWQPALTPDRLDSMLSLLASSRAIGKAGDGYCLETDAS